MALHHVLHIGDIHLAPGPRNADRRDALEQILGTAGVLRQRGELACVWIPGDLFHAEATDDDRNWLGDFLQRMADRAPVVITQGNHDRPGALYLFGKLDAVFPIHVIDAPRVIHVVGATGLALEMFCLPYPHKAGLVGAGVAHDAIAGEAAQRLDAIFLDAAAQLERSMTVGDAIAFNGHLNIGGAISSIGQPQIGREIELSPLLLARLPFRCAKALNHIHKHQELCGAVYAGSIARLDFGENEPKGFVEWIYDDGARTWSWAFRPLEVPRQLLINGQLTTAGFLFDSGEDAALDVAGADVRVRYTFRQAEAGLLNLDALRAQFAAARSLKLDPIAIVERELRAPAIADAPTLDAKAEAFCDLNGIDWTASLAAKLTALQAPDGAALLTQLAAELAQAGAPAPEAVEV